MLGQRHILCLTRQGLVSLDPTNGAVNFSRWFQSPVSESVNAMCPVVFEDLVLILGGLFPDRRIPIASAAGRKVLYGSLAQPITPPNEIQ